MKVSNHLVLSITMHSRGFPEIHQQDVADDQSVFNDLKQKTTQFKNELGRFTKNARRRPTLPHLSKCSTIGAEGLSFRVRNGAGRFPLAMVAETLLSYQSNIRDVLCSRP